MEIVLIYLFTFLFPINGIIWLGMRAENEKKRKLLKSLWAIRRGGKY